MGSKRDEKMLMRFLSVGYDVSTAGQLPSGDLRAELCMYTKWHFCLPYRKWSTAKKRTAQ